MACDARSTLEVRNVPGIDSAPGPFAINDLPSAFTEATPTLTWQASAHATSYTVVIAADAACASPVQTHDKLLGTSLKTQALADGTYHVCLAAVNGKGATRAHNSGLPLVVRVNPDAFAITAPLSPTDGPAPTVAWDEAKGARTYDLVVATDDACTQAVQIFPGLEATSQALAALADGTYHACVTARDANGHERAASNQGFAFTVSPLTCDSGTLRTTCLVSTVHRIPTGTSVEGPGRLVIANGGALVTGSRRILFDDFNAPAMNPSYVTKNGTWTQGDGVLRQTAMAPMYVGQRLLLADKAYPRQATITAKVRIDDWADSGNPNVGIGLGGDTVSQGEGYNMLIEWDGSSHDKVQFIFDGVEYGGTVWDFAWTQGVWYWFKMSLDADTLRGKIWRDGTPEPAAWMFTQTGPTWKADHGTLPRVGVYPILQAGMPASFDQVEVTTDQAWGQAAVAMGQDVSVAAGGALTGTFSSLVAQSFTLAGTLTGNFPRLEAKSDLTLESTGLIDASAWGSRGVVDASGEGAGGGSYVYHQGGGGGGHGGAGGDGGLGSGTGGAAHGSGAGPTTFGSAGAAGWYKTPGAAGGGAIKIIAPGTMTLKGRIAANGAVGMDARCLNDWIHAGGGGAGGSIWLTGGTLTGNGSIEAKGGAGGAATCNAGAGGGGGGGGRVKTSFSTNAFSGGGGSISVNGGTGGSGGAGGAAGLGGGAGTQS